MHVRFDENPPSARDFSRCELLDVSGLDVVERSGSAERVGARVFAGSRLAPVVSVIPIQIGPCAITPIESKRLVGPGEAC
jgi:hypothetical protein